MGDPPNPSLTCGRRTLGAGTCPQACCSTNPQKKSLSAPIPTTSTELGTSHPCPRIGEDIDFHLSPAINFDNDKLASNESAPLQYQGPFNAPLQDTQIRSKPVVQRQLKSSPRTIAMPSRCSTRSPFELPGSLLEDNPTQHDHPSDQAIEELKNYASSFDQTRKRKRGVSTR